MREVLDREGIGAVQGGPEHGRILDAACGGGLVALPLADAGFDVLGIDLSAGAVEAAQGRTPEGASATFRVGDATALEAVEGVAPGAFDAVLLLDMLEHVEDTPAVLASAARALRPGGVMVFNTFNQTPLAWLVAIHGFKAVVREAPAHLHVYHLFQPPEVLTERCAAAGLDVREIRGVRPELNRAFWRSVRRRRVDPGFRFRYSASDAIGYLGYAIKQS